MSIVARASGTVKARMVTRQPVNVHLGVRLIEERAEGLAPAQLAELLHCVAVHHEARGARTAEAAVLYHANQLDAIAATRRVD